VLDTHRNYDTSADIMRTEKKGKHLNALEKYHIYKFNKNMLHVTLMHGTTRVIRHSTALKETSIYSMHKNINTTNDYIIVSRHPVTRFFYCFLYNTVSHVTQFIEAD
jgi:hypothetical protein